MKKKMQTDFYKLIRFKTGEVIVCRLESDVRSPVSENVLTVHDPVQVVTHQENRIGIHVTGENFILRPWLGLSDSEEFMVASDSIMTIGNLRREVRDIYKTYVENMHESKRISQEEFSRSDAAESLLREVSPGVYKIVDLDPLEEEEHDEQ